MTSLMLGDNPFFAISHLGPEKTQQYLRDDTRFAKARDVITLAGSLGFDDFMISSHAETQSLLESAGYYAQDGPAAALPKLVVNIPNVHKMTSDATKKGVIGGFLSSATDRRKVWDLLKSIAHLPRGLGFVAARSAVQSMIAHYPPDAIGHVCVHNIFTDLLLGIGKPKIFRVLTDAIESLGYKPAYISLNLLADVMSILSNPRLRLPK